jgi:sucrose-6-phosphate hydrolase SacC (GH32 family)
MYFGDTTRLGRPFSKDPMAVRFQERYLLYYSIPNTDRNEGWGIGVAESRDLTNWQRIGEIEKEPNGPEAKGLCAPGAIVLDGKVHLFYQTYGNGKRDAICHAWSEDGVSFQRDATNPVFRPTGDWNCGRAIDADVVEYQGRLWLYGPRAIRRTRSRCWGWPARRSIRTSRAPPGPSGATALF